MKMNDNLELVVCILKDVLGEMKAAKVDREEIVKELVRFDMMKLDEDEEIDYDGIFHPNKMINEVVNIFVDRHKKRRVENMEHDDDDAQPPSNAEGVDSNTSNTEEAINIPSAKKVLVSLVNIYPDVDQMFLRQICVKLNFDPSQIQDWLEKNISTIPEKRQVQALHRTCLESSCGPEEELWGCPGCGAWHLVKKHSPVFSCKEIVSCGDFCSQCDRKEHSPFPCRPKSGRVDRTEDGGDMFEKLKTKPDEDKGFAKIFVLNPDNNIDFSNPMHILYLVAEGACRRMTNRRGCTRLSPVNMSSQALSRMLAAPPPRSTATPLSSAASSVNSTVGGGPVGWHSSVTTLGQAARNLSVINYQPSSQVSTTTPSTAGAPTVSQGQDTPSDATASPSTVAQTLPFPAWPSNTAGSSSPATTVTPPSSSSSTSDQSSLPAQTSTQNIQPVVATNIQHYPRFYQTTQQAVGGVHHNIHQAQSPAGSRSLRLQMQQYLAQLPRLATHHPRYGMSAAQGITMPSHENGEKKKSIKYIETESLRARFQACKSSFLSRGIPHTERLVFHGTNADLDSIIEHNFRLDLCKRSAHGMGFYFSEFLDICKSYGQKILLCRVLVGNSYEGSECHIPQQYQSKFVQVDPEGKAEMIIIDNADQILPAFIIEGF